MISLWPMSSGGPAYVQGLSPAAWYKYGVGITVTGAGVSTWADQSGNGRDLLQGTDTNRPALQADNSILFDGTDNYLQSSGFTLNQPETVYLLMKQVTWTSADFICDGVAASMQITQNGTTPTLRLFAGSLVAPNTELAVDAYGVVAAVFSGASSLLQINNGTPTTGNAGAQNAGGFTLGATRTPSAYSNIQVKEAIVFPAAHDADVRAGVIRYLRGVGGI